jgi:hypothetical protein
LTPKCEIEKQLKSFGLLVGGIFASIGVWPLLVHQRGVRLWAIYAASPLVILALLVPRFLAPIYKVWMGIGHGLGWINTRIILGLSFYLIFLPTAIVMRLLRKDPMNRQFLREAESYRVVRPPRPRTHLKHPF